MATKLEIFLTDISPEATLEKAQKTADGALNSFSSQAVRPETWEDFIGMMGEFFCLLDSRLLGINRPMDFEMDWGRCSSLLHQRGGPRGDREAFKIAQTGTGGGLYEILKFVASAFSQQIAGSWIRVKIGSFWNELSADERVSVPLEYLNKFQSILPPEILEQNPYVFAAHFYQFLEHHPQMMQQLRKTR